MFDLLQNLELIDAYAVYNNLTAEIHIWHIVRDEIGNVETWRLVYVNRPALKTWGFESLEEIKGKTTDEIFGEGSTEHYLAVVKKITEENVPHSFTDYFEHLDKHFRFTSIPFGDYFITTGNDITEFIKERVAIQQRNEELNATAHALAKSELRMKLAADSAGIGIWDFNIDNNVLVWDDQMYELYGITSETFSGSYEAWTKSLHPDDILMAEQVYVDAVNGDGQFHTEFRVKHPNGSVRWIKSDAWTHEDPSDGCYHMVGINQDITAQKQAENALVESKERFQQLYDRSEVSIFDEDYSGVLNYLKQLRNEGITDLRSYLETNTAETEKIAGLIKVNRVNAATLKLFKAKNEQEMLNSVYKVFGPGANNVFIEQLVALWEDKPIFKSDGTLTTLTGEMIEAHISMPLPKTEEGYKHIPVSIFDITEHKQAQERLRHQASHDALTGLISRYEFEQRVTRALSTAGEDMTAHAMCFLDLDQFKVINDTCGHSAGDELLRQIARVLQETIRKRDTLARLGGDEFGVLMEHCTIEQAKRASQAILNAVTDYHFVWGGAIFRIGVSIGLVEITDADEDFTELFKQADSACYLAKELGRNQVREYRPDDTRLALRHGQMEWVARITQALDKDQFCLFAQPINSLKTDEIKHYELLIRMQVEDGEVIPPGSFLPAAERYNLIERVDTWVVRHACQVLQNHPLFVDKIDFISINLSGPSFTSPNALNSIMGILQETGVSPRKICFEITETMAISNFEQAVSFIKNLKELGCRFALDDFGSGISSFGYLKKLPVDYLKIDGMFVKDIVHDPIDRAMVKSINDIGQVMGMKTIAEFVQDDEISSMLKAIGVNYGQGYGIGKPEPLLNLLGNTG
jgi:diguanylate cyclase (GGDEF)-like protein/PAS domain S-box-containing protein